MKKQKSARQAAPQASIFCNMADLEPLTEMQSRVIQAYEKNKNLMICGYPGTGKSYIACALALASLAENKCYNVRVIRSVVPSRDMGFLPGTEQEKMEVYERPYISIVNSILGRGDAYDVLKQRRMISFESSSFLRGVTYDNSILIVDEFQNMSEGELNTIITRVGENTRIILCGDIAQSDLNASESGFREIKSIIDSMPHHFSVMEMGIDDIVRSGLVKDYIIAKEKIKAKKLDKSQK